jgi:hypothetical protein
MGLDPAGSHADVCVQMGAFIGIWLGLAFQFWFIKYRYGGLWKRSGQPPPLEEFLWTMLFGSVCVPVR